MTRCEWRSPGWECNRARETLNNAQAGVCPLEKQVLYVDSMSAHEQGASLSVQMMSLQLSVDFLGKRDGAPPLSPDIWFACVLVCLCASGRVGEKETLRWPRCIISLPMTSWVVSCVKLLLAASQGCREGRDFEQTLRKWWLCELNAKLCL